MSLEGWTAADCEAVRRALAACAEGPFFLDCEFDTLFGLTRSEFREAAGRWTQLEHLDAQVELAVNGALGNLLGYPHGMEARLEAEFGISRRELDEVLRRWRAR